MTNTRGIHRLLLIAISFLPTIPAWSQATAMPYTSGIRYDAAKRLVGTIDPDPDGTGPLRFAASRKTYDARGVLTREEEGQLSTWQPESISPSSWTGFAVSRQTDYTYDIYGRRVSQQMSSGGVAYTLKQFSYDSASRLECTATRMNAAAFAAAFNLTACQLGAQGTAGPDRIEKVGSYDLQDRPLTILRAYGTPLQQTYATYTYVGAHMASSRDAKGNVSTYQVDGFARLEYLRFPSPTTAGQTSTTDYERYGYDENGNRTQLRKRDNSVINYTYDAVNRLSTKDLPGTAADVSYRYDLRGLQLSARFSATGLGVTNTYDGFGRNTESSTNLSGGVRALSFGYDANGNRTRVTHPDGAFFEYSYDGLDRLTEILENGSSSLISMSYNAQGRRAQLIRGNSASVSSFKYDPISRLSSLSQNLDGVGTASDVTQSFTFNPARQIVTRSLTNNAYRFSQTVPNRTYGVNGLNQYTQVASPGALTHAYDLNGNLTSDGLTTFGYDAENRLTSASGAKNATLTYDPNGRLHQTSGANVTQFLYDGDQLVGEYNSSGSLQRRYVHGTDIDEPLVWYEGAGVSSANRRFLHANHQGSIIAVANNTGTTLEIDTYDPYGIPGPTNTSRFQYTGQASIPELGLYYYKARFYSPDLGRFLQTDPVGYKDDLNLYTYVGNNPVNANDPSGEFIMFIPAIITGARLGYAAYQAYRVYKAAKTIKTVVVVATATATAAGIVALNEATKPDATPADKPAADKPKEDAKPKPDDRPKNNDNPQDTEDSITKEQDRAKGERPSTESGEWEGAKKRPKSSRIESTKKSNDRAQHDRKRNWRDSDDGADELDDVGGEDRR
jgi:RHS repeat-associated protein